LIVVPGSPDATRFHARIRDTFVLVPLPRGAKVRPVIDGCSERSAVPRTRMTSPMLAVAGITTGRSVRPAPLPVSAVAAATNNAVIGSP
jgi:hypothetical protein